MITYAMESFKCFIFNKLAKMLKTFFFCFTIIVFGVQIDVEKKEFKAV